ncbi:putative zinc transporter msc2 [Coemansia sp. RSA 1365]|nr:putative zinc transporter msc2 [Coemansia sp. RSA 1365]
MSRSVSVKSSRPPMISTIEEYDRSRGRKRIGSEVLRLQQQHNHTHVHEHKYGNGISKAWKAPLPIHMSAKGEKQRLAVSLWKLASRTRQFMRIILSDPESRSIFMFLLLNLSYMVVQVIYGYITNSLGLISDAIHMLFDCMALAIGLVAAVMSRWPSDKAFTFGYGRIEILSGFANGVFLMLISVSIFFEAIERLLYPPEMNTQRLLLVSFGGLVVNMLGILAFNGHHHHHGGGCSHSHNHDHSHDHNHSHHRSHNMQGVFLHVMADTLGSVGVIISTLLIQRFGWTGFDPIASLAIAGLIFASVVPLVRDSMRMLLLRLPDRSQAEVQRAVAQIIEEVDGITKPVKVQFWPITETQIMGIIHVAIDPNRNSIKDELPLCAITMRENASRAIGDIVRANVSDLLDVFVHVDVENATTAEKKCKKSKKSENNKDTPAAKADQPNESASNSSAPTPSGWNNWAAAEFENEERKSKFLRFMGIKGSGGTSAPSNGSSQKESPFASAISKEGANRIQSDLEKQYGAGIQQRRQGQRGGLGF